jgi:hypothetical protein
MPTIGALTAPAGSAARIAAAMARAGGLKTLGGVVLAGARAAASGKPER